jgi:ribosomal protein L11 methyltransferase
MTAPPALPVRWLELSVEAGHEAVEAVSEILGRVSSGTAVRPMRLLRDPGDELLVRADPTSPHVVTAHIPDDGEAAPAIERSERALWHLQAFGLGPVGELRVRAVTDDWTDAWRRTYVPQRIGRLTVMPSWADGPHDGPTIVMDPGMAFGTGLHPTTRACLLVLQEAEPMPAAVLDVGSGSGILALAALELGAGRATAIDTDPLAVTATRANARLNGLADRITVADGGLPHPPLDRFPLVLANLVAALHVELAPRLAAHVAPGGALIAGGIIAGRAPEALEALRDAGLLLDARRDDGEWVTLRLRRPA